METWPLTVPWQTSKSKPKTHDLFFNTLAARISKERPPSHPSFLPPLSFVAIKGSATAVTNKKRLKNHYKLRDDFFQRHTIRRQKQSFRWNFTRNSTESFCLSPLSSVARVSLARELCSLAGKTFRSQPPINISTIVNRSKFCNC